MTNLQRTGKLWNQKVNYEEAYELFKQGESLKDLAELYGVTEEPLRKGFVRRGWIGNERNNTIDGIIALVASHPGLSYQRVADNLKITRQKATWYIEALIKSGLLYKKHKKLFIQPSYPKETPTEENPHKPIPYIEECIRNTFESEYFIATIEILIKRNRLEPESDAVYYLEEIKDILQKNEDARLINTRPAGSSEFVMIARFKNGGTK